VTNELTFLRGQNSQQQEELEICKQQNAANFQLMKKRLSEKDSKISEMNEKCSEVDVTSTIKIQEISNLNAELNYLKAQLSETVQTLGKVEHEKKLLIQNQGELHYKLQNEQKINNDTIQTLQDEIGTMKSKQQASHEKEMTDLKKEIKELKESQSEVHINQLIDELKELKKKHEDKTQNINAEITELNKVLGSRDKELTNEVQTRARERTEFENKVKQMLEEQEKSEKIAKANVERDNQKFSLLNIEICKYNGAFVLSFITIVKPYC
jgi:chromosome segregation ATPase